MVFGMYLLLEPLLCPLRSLYDGRTLYDGKRMISRLGNPFTPPQWLLDSMTPFPPESALKC